MAAMQELVSRVDACRVTETEGAAVKPVNHPDTHFVRNYDTRNGRIVLSLKDKAALGQSYVFLQIQKLPQN